MAKGHMNRPRHGIHSTTPKQHTHSDRDDAIIANVFCFGAFADKNTGVVYNDMTGNFPFMSLDGSVCYLIVYHYETNYILATPIKALENKSIFQAYKLRFDKLTAKGFKPKLNMMDNQATKYIKQLFWASDKSHIKIDGVSHQN